MYTKGYPLKKLIIPLHETLLEYNGIKFRLQQNCEGLEKQIATNLINPTSKGTWDVIIISTQKGIPEEYLDIIIVHEVVEGCEQLYHNTPPNEAHKIAAVFHMQYAKKFKDDDTLQKFLAWQNKFEYYQRRETEKRAWEKEHLLL